MHKIYETPRQQKSKHDWGWRSQNSSPFLGETDYQLLSGKGEFTFFKGVAPGRLNTCWWMTKNSRVYRQYNVDLIF